MNVFLPPSSPRPPSEIMLPSNVEISQRLPSLHNNYHTNNTAAAASSVATIIHPPTECNFLTKQTTENHRTTSYKRVPESPSSATGDTSSRAPNETLNTNQNNGNNATHPLTIRPISTSTATTIQTYPLTSCPVDAHPTSFTTCQQIEKPPFVKFNSRLAALLKSRVEQQVTTISPSLVTIVSGRIILYVHTIVCYLFNVAITRQVIKTSTVIFKRLYITSNFIIVINCSFNKRLYLWSRS